MSRLLDHLRGHGEKVAVLTDSQQLSYHQLADAVADTARELGGARRLVLLETRNDLATLVHYLAAMAGGHVVLPVDARRDHTAILQTYEPDVVIDANGIHRGGGRHRLHDDLALLLSTSGSTGSPKLVRLSHRNLVSPTPRPLPNTSTSAKPTGPQPPCRCPTATGFRLSTATCCAARA